MSSLQSRILIGLVGFPSVIYVILNHILVFNMIVVFCFVLAFREFIKIVSNFDNRTYWLFFGTIYIFGSMMSLIFLRSIDSLLSSPFTFLLFAGVMINDSMAFIVGKAIGGPKILPTISPKKTYSGLFGGLISSLSIASLYIYYIEIDLDLKSLIFVASIILFSFVGDIIESYFKRKNNLKNSSNFIPGHGGFFDRFDSFIFAIIFYSVTNVYLI